MEINVAWSDVCAKGFHNTHHSGRGSTRVQRHSMERLSNDHEDRPNRRKNNQKLFYEKEDSSLGLEGS